MFLRRMSYVTASVLLCLGVIAPVVAQESAAREPSGSVQRAPTLGEIYPSGRTQSPITPAVAGRLRRLLQTGNGNPDVFVKIGASATVNRNFLRCFAGPQVDLAEHDHLEETLGFFNEADGTNPFLRNSEAAVVGWHAGRAVWGSPPPLVREVRDMDPRFAVVMFGTNDLELGRPQLYASLLMRLTQMLTVRGVIPIFSTIMPRDDDEHADLHVDLYNAVVRGVAQMHQVPMVDLHRELSALPDHGLASDELHPNVLFVDHNPRGCDFGDEGLRHGYNVRNLITLTALDRLRRHVVEGEAAPDQPAPRPRGSGSFAHPIQVSALPFSHASDTSRSPHSDRDRYGCGSQDESGAEVVYRLTLEEPARIAALLAYDHQTDVDLHLLRDGRCVQRADDYLATELQAGTYEFAVDTYVNQAGDPHDGRYLFVVSRIDQPSDPD